MRHIDYIDRQVRKLRTKSGGQIIPAAFYNDGLQVRELIDQIINGGAFDQIQVLRLKKRKLVLKDKILRLRSMLIPNTIA